MIIKITKVELQKKDNTRFNLYTDEGYLMSVSMDNLAPYGYTEFEISVDELEELRLKEEQNLAYKMAIQYSSRNMKTSKEVRDYLWRKEISNELIEEIIVYLEDLGILDDQRYLELYLEDRYNLYDDGQYKIKNNLYKKGFNSDIVDPLLEEYSEIERSNLQALIKKRRSRRKNEDTQKLVRYLLNKGYHYGMIKEELSIIDEY